MKQATLPIQLFWTPRPAPYLPGLYSVQAVAGVNTEPVITVYRKSLTEVEMWTRKMSYTKKYREFFVRGESNRVDLYNRSAQFSQSFAKPTFEGLLPPSKPVKIDLESITQETRTTLDLPTLTRIVTAQQHSGASAADFSNFGCVCRRMVMEAGSKDLPHFYIVESNRWPCRTMSIFATIEELSSPLQDAFLDAHQWLKNGWPLHRKHHKETLADRLSDIRSDYITSMLPKLGCAAGMTRGAILIMQTRWMRAPREAKFRFTQHIVETLQDGLWFETREAETFSDDIIDRCGAEAVRGYEKLLA